MCSWGKISKQAQLNSAKRRMNSSEPESTVPCEELPVGVARLLGPGDRALDSATGGPGHALCVPRVHTSHFWSLRFLPWKVAWVSNKAGFSRELESFNGAVLCACEALLLFGVCFLPSPSLPLLSWMGGLASLFLGTSLRPESGWLSGSSSHTLWGRCLGGDVGWGRVHPAPTLGGRMSALAACVQLECPATVGSTDQRDPSLLLPLVPSPLPLL